MIVEKFDNSLNTALKPNSKMLKHIIWGIFENIIEQYLTCKIRQDLKKIQRECIESNLCSVDLGMTACEIKVFAAVYTMVAP